MTGMTPAQKQASLLLALGEHLTIYSYLPTVGVLHNDDLQVRGALSERGAEAVLLWADTLDNPRVEIARHGEDATFVAAYGSIGGHELRVWDVDRGDLRRLTADEPTLITRDQLAAYVAFGTVEDES